MSELPSPSAKENGAQSTEETKAIEEQMIAEGPPQTNDVITDFNYPVSSESDSDTNVEIKSGNCVQVIPMDDDEFCSELEAEDYNNHDSYQSRKHAISSLTSRHYAAHVRVFKDWLTCKGLPAEFEQCAPQEISTWLSVFYKESHLKHGGTKKASSLRIIRSAIDHHLRSEPHCRPFSLTHSPEFCKANAMLHNLEAAQREAMNAASEINTSALPLKAEDVRRLWVTGVVGVKSPKALQRLVFLGVGINFGITSRDDLRDLKPEMFEFNIDDKTSLEFAKCKLGDSPMSQLRSRKAKCTGRKMFSVPGSFQCPVAALKLFLKRRNPACIAFFQIPNRDFATSGVWFRSQAAGVNCLSGMMKDMSQEALLSKEYANHNLRATPPIVLYKAMEDSCSMLSLPSSRISDNINLNNKIALNCPGSTVLNMSTAVNLQAVNANMNHDNVIPADSSAACLASGSFGTCANVNDPSKQMFSTNAVMKAHHVLCLPQKWNIEDIVTAVRSGDALVLAKQPAMSEVLRQERRDVTPLREVQREDSDEATQYVSRDRSGRKQPEPKRLRRDPDSAVKDETFKGNEAYMEVINGINSRVQSLDDLASKQPPSGQVIQELSNIRDKIQDFLQRINKKDK